MPGTAVFICDCMGQVSDHVDTASLEALARTWDEVTLVRREGKLCGRQELAGMAAALGESGADRLLFAGCSPRMSLKLPEDLLEQTARDAGLDPALVEVANIREQGAWLQTDDPDQASARARDLLRMARARLQIAEPTAPAVPLEKRVLVVGAGPAGLSATQELAQAGVPVTLVEKKPYLGGKMCQLNYIFQTEGWPSSCESNCTGPVHARRADIDPLVTAHLSSEVTDLRKQDGNFIASVKVGPRFVDPDACISCGKCEEVCPEQTPSPLDLGVRTRKAIAKESARAVPDCVTIVDEACTRCGDCLPVCPTGAIDLEAKETTEQVRAGAVILATGTEPRDPAASPELGSAHPNVITSLQMERLIRHGVERPTDGEEPEHIVYVQCAGSRAGMHKQGSGVPYCSKTCCSVTAKQVKRLAMDAPMTEVSVLYYRDFRTYERALEKLHQDLESMGIEFHNGEVTAVAPSTEDDELLEVRYDQLGCAEDADGDEDGGGGSLECDMVVLACAQEPRLPDAARALGLPTDPHGFPIENQPRLLRPTETFVDRVYAVGAAVGPKAMQPAVGQGTQAALKAIQALSPGERVPLKHASKVDAGRCSACGVCASVCPHGAVRMTDDGAVVEEAFCQGCGMCGASCPSHAAALRNFTDERLLAEVDAAFTEAPADQPRLLALLCYWCAYGGADLAGAERLSLPASVRTMRVRCSCSVNLGLVTEMFRRGVDGVFIGGCPENSCHHMWGNWLSHKRGAMMKTLMEQAGLDPRRLKYDVIGIPHAKKFADELGKMHRMLAGLGPNPWRQGDGAALNDAEVSWLTR